MKHEMLDSSVSARLRRSHSSGNNKNGGAFFLLSSLTSRFLSISPECPPPYSSRFLTFVWTGIRARADLIALPAGEGRGEWVGAGREGDKPPSRKAKPLAGGFRRVRSRNVDEIPEDEAHATPVRCATAVR